MGGVSWGARSPPAHAHSKKPTLLQAAVDWLPLPVQIQDDDSVMTYHVMTVDPLWKPLI